MMANPKSAYEGTVMADARDVEAMRDQLVTLSADVSQIKGWMIENKPVWEEIASRLSEIAAAVQTGGAA